MKNKKLVLSVLSTAVVASMASSAFAAPQAGLYFNNTSKFYKLSDVLNLSDSAYAEFKTALTTTANWDDIVLVKDDGKGAFISEILDTNDPGFDEALVAEDFLTSYNVVGTDGNTTGTYDARANLDDVPAGELKVESVSAINLKQVKVAFNKEVDETSAETPANYTYTGALGNSIASYELQADKKSVLITLANAEAQQASATLVVKDVKDSAGNKLASTTQTVSFLDTTVPTAVAAKVVAPTKIEIEFSELIKTGALANAAFSIDNNTYSLVGAPVVNGNKVTITTGAALPAGSHKVTINPTAGAASNVMDFANFQVAKVDVSFTYAADTVAPVATVKTATQTSVTLEFSKEVSFAGAGALNTDFTVYHTYNNQASYLGNATLAADNKTLTVTFAAPLPAGNVTLYLNNTADATKQLQDAWGNKFSSSTLSATVGNDTTAPTVTSVSYVDSTHVDVTFSEAVTGVAASDFTLKTSAGTAVQVIAAPVQTGNTYRLQTGTALNGDTYTLSIAADSITDTSINANKIAAYSTTFTVADTVAPTVTATGSYSADSKKVFISFSEKMATSGAGSVLDVTNYRFSTSAGANPSALPAGTTISLGADGKSVVINFTSAVAGLGAGNFEGVIVGQVKDLAGNSTAALSNQVVLTGAALTGASISEVKATSRNTITFKVNSNLSAVDVADFTVDGAAATSVSYVNGTGEATVTVVAPASKWNTSLSDLDANAVVIAAGGLTTDQNVSNTGAITLANTAVADYVAPTIASRTIADTDADSKYDTVTVTFSEALQASSVAYDAFTVEGYTVADVDVAGSAVTLTLTELSAADLGATPKVQLVKAVRDDSAQHNTIAAETTGNNVTASVSGVTAAAVNVVDGTAGTPATAGVDTLTFVAGWAAGDTITIDGVTLTGANGASTGTNFDTTADTAAAIATAVKASVDANATLSAKYTVADNAAGVLTFTQKAGQESATALAVTEATVGAGTATEANTTPGVAAVAATNEVATLTISTGATNAGSIAVTVNGVTTSVAVAAGDSATVVAGKIRTALTGNVTGYTVGGAGADVTFTATATGNVANLTATVAN